MNNSNIKTYIANIFLKASPQFNHSNLLEFQTGLKAVDHYKDKEGMSSRQRMAIIPSR